MPCSLRLKRRGLHTIKTTEGREILNERRDLDAAIDRLDDALRGAGLAGLEPPADLLPLDEVAEAVAPYDLPSDIQHLWQRVDPRSIAVTMFPELVRPSDALGLLGVIRDPDFYHPGHSPPPLLFPIAYSSHVHLSIELVSERVSDGPIFRWAWTEDSFHLVYRSLADLLDVVAELISEGRTERRGGFVLLPSGIEEEKRLERLQAAGPHPLYGDVREIAKDLQTWPAHWLRSAGIDLRDREPLGATHTIAELVAAAGDGPVTGRIWARILRTVGMGGDTLLLVDDGTRPLDIWCPAGTRLWGPGHDERFEFEVTVEGPVPPPPDLDTGHANIVRHALAGRHAEAEAAHKAFFSWLQRRRPAAVATAVRPID